MIPEASQPEDHQEHPEEVQAIVEHGRSVYQEHPDLFPRHVVRSRQRYEERLSSICDKADDLAQSERQPEPG